jgi:hypothetical protein
MVTAMLKSLVGDITVSTTDPMGKSYKYDFNKKNEFQLEVPTEIKYKTLSGKVEVFQENYAQHLLDSVKVTHGESKGSHVFELVEQIQKPIVETKAKKSEKEKKHEKE